MTKKTFWKRPLRRMMTFHRHPAMPHQTAGPTLFDAITDQDCPLCLAATRAKTRYLEMLFYENINDPGVRQQCRAASGFCSQHTADLVPFADPLGASILYFDILTSLISTTSDAWDPQPCPVCEVEEDAVHRQATEVMDWAHDHPQDNNLILCWDHLRLLMRHPQTSKAIRTRLWQKAQAHWKTLLPGLQAVINSDYQHPRATQDDYGTWRAVVAYFHNTTPSSSK